MTEDRITYTDEAQAKSVSKFSQRFNQLLGLPDNSTRSGLFEFLRRENNTGKVSKRIIIFLVIVDNVFNVVLPIRFTSIYASLFNIILFNFIIIFAYSLYYCRTSEGKLDYGQMLKNLLIGILVAPLGVIGFVLVFYMAISSVF